MQANGRPTHLNPIAGYTVDDLGRDLDVAYPAMIRTLRRRGNSHHDAEDIAQEAALRAFVHRTTIDEQRGAQAWLHTVSQRIAIDQHRSARAAHTEPYLDQISVGDHTFDTVAANELLDAVHLAMEQIPPRQRRVLTAQAIHGMTYEDIAAREGIPLSSVKSLLARSRESLRTLTERIYGSRPFLAIGGFAARLGNLIRKFVPGFDMLSDRLAAGIAAAISLATGLLVGLSVATTNSPPITPGHGTVHRSTRPIFELSPDHPAGAVQLFEPSRSSRPAPTSNGHPPMFTAHATTSLEQTSARTEGHLRTQADTSATPDNDEDGDTFVVIDCQDASDTNVTCAALTIVAETSPDSP